MAAFISLLLFAATCSFVFHKNRYSNGSRLLFFILLYLFTTLYAGLRYKVGIDTLNYMSAYTSLIPASWGIRELLDNFTVLPYQPLYALLVIVSKSISPEFWVMQLLHALILNALIFGFIWNNAKEPFIAVIIYLLVYYLNFNMEIMRESLAVGVFLFFSRFLFEGKWIKYYIGVFIAVMFHISALILVLFPLALMLKPDRKLIIVLAVMTGVFYFMKVLAEMYIPLLVSDGSTLTSKVQEHMSAKDSIWSVFGLLWEMTRSALLPFLFLYVYSIRNRIDFKYDKMILMSIVFCAGIPFFQIVFSRFTNYTFPFCALLYSDFIYSFLVKKIGGIKCILCHFALLAVIFYYYNATAGMGYKWYQKWFPYHSVLEPKTEQSRENIKNLSF